MAIFDTISFPDFDWVTDLPTIDGWTGNPDPGVAAHFPEPGYAPGGRITYSGGASVPPVAFQCVHANIADPGHSGLPVDPGSYLVMGFFCTFDPTFDAADGITIALLPDFATKTHTTARRIDLLPNTDGVGAGAPVPGVDPIPGQAANYYGRLNRDLAAAPTCWQGIGANPAPPPTSGVSRWSSIGVKNVYAKCASWVPSTVSTTAAAAQTVPTTTTSTSAPFTLQVVDVSQFPDAGDLLVPITGNPAVNVAYTGRNIATNTFTGCTVRKATTGGSVDVATNVQLLDVGWSVEVLIPATKALGKVDAANDNWIDLSGHFGLYINLFRFSVWQPSPPGTPHAGFLAAQYRFPLPDAGAADQQFLTGSLDDTPYIADSWYGQATIPAITGTNDAVGVCFQNVTDPVSSVGVRHSGSSTLTSTIYGPTGPDDNTLVAQIQNTDPANPASNVSAEFRFGKWGNPPTAFAQWNAATDFGAAPPNVLNLTASGGGTPSGEIASLWAKGSVPAVYAGDTCLWVRLDSTSNTAFAQDGVRHNMSFVDLSEHSAPATISGSGYPTPSGSHHDFLLLSHVRSQLVYPDRAVVAEGGKQTPTQVWHWIVESFRRTGLEFTVGDSKGEVLDPSPGQFGIVATHAGQPGDVFVSQLSGGGLKRSGNVHELKVPHNGEVTIQTWVGAGPAGSIKPPTPIDQGGGCLGFLLPFLNWIKKLLS